MTGGTIIHPDDQARVLAESVAGEASLKPFVLEARFRRGDGEWRWLRSISQPRWGAGRRACRLHRRRPRHHRMEARPTRGAARAPGRRAHRRPARRARPAAGRGRRARAGRGGAAPGAEDGGGRPADRRHRPRFQQSADAGHRRARDASPRGVEDAAAEADRRGGARIEPARRQADRPAARFLAHPADPDGAGRRSTR